MDITLLSKCIKEAICDLERVAVPHLGMFQAEFVPSVYSDKQTTINPPYRKMSFSRCNVSQAEAEQFMSFVAQKASVSPSQAETELAWCISRLRSELEVNKICELPGLGKMKANSAGDLFFVPDVDLDIYPQASGLEPVCIKKQQPLFNIVEQPRVEEHIKVEAETKAEEKKQVVKKEKKERRAMSKATRKTIVFAAVVLVLVGAIAAIFYFCPDEVSVLLDQMLYSKEELELLGR